MAVSYWQKETALPSYRQYPSCVAIGNQIYMIGGMNNQTRTTQVTIYNTSARTFSTTTSFPYASCAMRPVVYGGKIYCLGEDNIMYIFDPSTKKWTKGAKKPTSDIGNDAVLYSGKIYCAHHKSFEVYTISSNSWVSAAKPPLGTVSPNYSTVVLDGKIYLKSSNVAMQIYNISTKKWTIGSDQKIASTLYGGAHVYGRKIYYFQSGKAKTPQIYDVDRDQWSLGRKNTWTVSSLATNCLGSGAVYFFGGDPAKETTGFSYRFANTAVIHEYYQEKPSQQLRSDIVTEVARGSDYRVCIPYRAGYKAVGHKLDFQPVVYDNVIEIKDFQADHTIRFLYRADSTENEGLYVTEHYQLADGTPLISPMLFPVEPGDNYARTAPRLEGYKRVGYKVDGGEPMSGRTATLTDVQEDRTVTFLYEVCNGESCIDPDDVTITENYQLPDGTPVREGSRTILEPWEDYVKTAPRLEGYKRIGHQLNGGEPVESRTAVLEAVQEDHIVTFLYELCDGESCVDPDGIWITEHYQLSDGTPVLAPTKTELEPGEDYEKTASRLEGYKRIGHQVDDGEPVEDYSAALFNLQANHTVTFLYEVCDGENCVDPDGIWITEKYQLRSGTPVLDTAQTVLEPGQDYVETAPRLEGYKRIGHQVDEDEPVDSYTATLPNLQRNHTVIFLYEICDGESCVEPDGIWITEHYNLPDGTPVLFSTKTDMEQGGDYEKTAPRLEGYKRIGHRIDDGEDSPLRTVFLEDVGENHTVTFLYEPCDGEYCQDILITEQYLDVETGQWIQPDTTADLATGEAYEQTAPRLENYKRIGHRIDDGEDSPLRTAFIEDVREDHTVTFLYEPCDGEYCQDILITESYYDEVNKEYLRPDTYQYLAQGEDYWKAAPPIPGYKRVGHFIDDGERLSSVTAEILEVTEDHHVTFLYGPGEEEQGEDIPVTERYLNVDSGEYLRPDTKTLVPTGGSYRKTAPAIPGYIRLGHRVGDGADSASLTAVLRDVREPHVVTFLYLPDEGGINPPGKEVLIVEKYLDVENSVYIRSDTYTRIAKGGDYQKTAPAITGYDRLGHRIDSGSDSDNLMAVIENVQGMHVVTYLYRPKLEVVNPPEEPTPVTEEYYDVVNRVYIREDTQTLVDKGADYAKTAPTLSGYNRLGHILDSGAANGALTARIANVQDPHTATFLYEPTEEGGVEPPEDGLLITQRYYDVVGRKYLRPDTYAKVAQGGTYRKTAPAISGYFRVGHRIDSGADQAPIIAVIANIQQPHVVTFLYEPAVDCDDFAIRERYYDKVNGTYIRPDTQTLVEPGADYSKTAPNITGYTRVGHRIDNGAESTSLTATIENVRGDHTVIFLYIPEGGGEPGDELTITEWYYDKENGAYIRPDTHTKVKAGDNYSKTAPEIAGYIRVGHNIDGGVESTSLTASIGNVQTNHTVTFLYIPESGGGEEDELLITERYYDVENRVYIREDTYARVKAGDDYQKTAPRLLGYERIGHQVDGGDESPELTATVLNVRENHVVTFLYKPEEEDGKDPEPGDGDKNGNCCCCCGRGEATMDIHFHIPMNCCNEKMVHGVAKALRLDCKPCKSTDCQRDSDPGKGGGEDDVDDCAAPW